MQMFRMGKIAVICEFESTRNGFRHIAVLLISGYERDRTKCCYLNRTWERFQYQSVLRKLIDKTDMMLKSQKTRFRRKYDLEY